MADGREISMNHVASPTRYEPEDSNLPRGTRAGVTVHCSATTISDKWAHLPVLLLYDLSPTRKRGEPLAPSPRRRASNLRPPGRSPRALRLSYATDVAYEHVMKTTS